MSSAVTQRQIDWILEYNGYERLAGSPRELRQVIDPARDEYERTNMVPGWCGLDLLRGWAFFLIRADRLFADYGSFDSEVLAVLDAYARHPVVANRPELLPPGCAD